MRKRLLWMLPGLVVGATAMLALRAGFENRFAIVVDQLPLFCGMLSLWIAERKGMAPTAEEVSRPISLFSERPERK